MRLLVLIVFWLSVIKADDCPDRHPYQNHEENMISGGKPAFEMIVESRRLINEGYEPGEGYHMQVVARETGMKRVNVSVFNEQSSRCGNGSLDPKSGLTVVNVCSTTFLREVSAKSRRIVKFEWRAPHCGCVTLWATVLSDSGLFYSDDSKFTGGVLSKTFCMKEREFHCPQPYPAKYYGDNVLPDGTPAFEMKVHEDICASGEGYEPGIEYNFDVITRDVEFTRVNISAFNDEDVCGIGHLVPMRKLSLRRGCHWPSLVEESSEHKEIVKFTWQAPNCGCVTVWATVLTEKRTLFSGEYEDLTFVSRRICRKGEDSSHDFHNREETSFVDESFIDDEDEEFHQSIHSSVFPDDSMDTDGNYDRNYEYSIYDGISDIESRFQPKRPWKNFRHGNFRHGYDSYSDEDRARGGRQNGMGRWSRRHRYHEDSAANSFDGYEPVNEQVFHSGGTESTGWHRKGGRPGNGRRNKRRRWNGRYHVHDPASMFEDDENFGRYDSHSAESWWDQWSGRKDQRRWNTRGHYREHEDDESDEKDSLESAEEQEPQFGMRVWNGRRQPKFIRPGKKRWDTKNLGMHGQPWRQPTVPWHEVISSTEETPTDVEDYLDEDKYGMVRGSGSQRLGGVTGRHRMKKLKKRCCLLGKSSGQKMPRRFRWRNCARSSSALVKKLLSSGRRLKKTCMKVAKACCFRYKSRVVSVTPTPTSPTTAMSPTSSENRWHNEFPPGAKVVAFKIDVQPEKYHNKSSSSIIHRQ